MCSTKRCSGIAYFQNGLCQNCCSSAMSSVQLFPQRRKCIISGCHNATSGHKRCDSCFKLQKGKCASSFCLKTANVGHPLCQSCFLRTKAPKKCKIPLCSNVAVTGHSLCAPCYRPSKPPVQGQGRCWCCNNVAYGGISSGCCIAHRNVALQHGKTGPRY